MPKINEYHLRKVKDITVRTFQVNFKTNTLKRDRKAVNRWILYRIMFKYYSGVPIVYIALQYDVTIKEMERIIEVGKNYNSKHMVASMFPRDVYAESVQFFINLAVPLHIIAKIYNTSVDELIIYYENNGAKLRYWSVRADLLYKYHGRYRYFNTETGREVLAKIKEMIKWKD